MTELYGIDFGPFINFTWLIAQIVLSVLFWLGIAILLLLGIASQN